jgi:branched-chain amino acid transport system ATP-binding protein
VTFSLKKGRIVGFICPNGACKATCVNVITGFQIPRFGTVSLDGDSINTKAPHTTNILKYF